MTLQICLKFLIDDFTTVVQSVKLEIRPLFLPHLVRLIKIISPGLKELTWVSSDWKPFVDKVNDAVENFKILVGRAHDIYTNRIIEVLSTMQSVSLHALPEPYEDAWTVDHFIERIENVCRKAASELHCKSLMVEEAVEEILQLVRYAQQKFDAAEDSEFVFEGNNYCHIGTYFKWGDF